MAKPAGRVATLGLGGTLVSAVRPWHASGVDERSAGVTPLAAALWLARRHRDYLLGVEGEVDFSRWRSSLAASEVARVLAIGGALVRTWVADARAALGPIDPGDPSAWLERAGARVSSHLLTPFDVDFDCDRRLYAELDDANFEAGTPSRLLRGFVNCDGHSHLLALVLAGWTRAEVVSLAGHRLVRIPRFVRGPRLVDRLLGARPVYFDPYSELPPFVLARGLPGFASLDELDARVLARDRRYVARGWSPGEPLRPASAYAAAKTTPVTGELASAWPAELAPPEPPSSMPAPASDDVIGIYFEARAHHLFGAAADARSRYRSIASREGEQPGWIGSLRSAARIFADRLAP